MQALSRGGNLELLSADVCAGIGLLGRAWDSVGARCVYACEIDENARQVYIQNWGEPPIFDRDLFKVNPDQLPDFHILSAGFPCQSYSTMNDGWQETGGPSDIFSAIIEIIKSKKPYFVLLENVKNLLFIDYGDTFRDMVNDLESLGYFVDYIVLNSYGWTRQKRKRLFITACKDNLPELSELTLKQEMSYDKVLDPCHSVPASYDLSPKITKSMLKRVGKFSTIVDHNTKVFRTFLRRYRLSSSSGDFVKRENGKYRHITSQEASRLFGVPENFKLHPNEKISCSLLGNSVVYPLVLSLVRELYHEINRRISAQSNRR